MIARHRRVPVSPRRSGCGCPLLLALLLASSPLFGRDHIGVIEFFGYKGIDLEAVRHALPVHQGDPLPIDTKERVQQAIKHAIKPEPTDVALVCCDEHGDTVIFIGLPGSLSKPFSYNSQPSGTARLSAEIRLLDERFEEASEAAVHKGGDAAQEDDSNGYALIKDPPTRSIQLAIRDYALRHEDEILTVLQSSSDARQRAIAPGAWGYARQSRRQIAALVRASRDPDDDVRNNAVRALAVLASSSPAVAHQIPAAPFIAMIDSGIWTDRNKSTFLLDCLTGDRSPKVLARLRAKALDSLIEMARWHDPGHAYTAQILLARIAGIPEERAIELITKGQIDVILSAVSRK